MSDSVRAIAGVCEVEFVRGSRAAPDAEPDLLFEVAHGATRAHHFDELRAALSGSYDDGLRDFFFVNTDVGAPEIATAVARGAVAAQPQRTAVVVRCSLPRTLIDCNRRIDRDSVGRASKAGEMTPGLPPWVVEPRDRDALLERYFAYHDVVAAAFAQVCSRDGGLALCAHTYAPRSIDVAVDDDIVASLHDAYRPDRIESWPLRAEIDLITHDEQGRELAAAALARRAEAAWRAAGREVVRNHTYNLHASTVAYEYAARYPGRTLCFEARRDLVLDAFVPFVELVPDPDKVAALAAPLVAALSPDRGTAGP